jgi:hypothetical protein
MLINLDEIANGVLINAITATGRLLRVPTSAVFRNRRLGQDVTIARWFDTYE